MSKADNPKTYKAPHDVFVDGQYVKAGVPFTTTAEKGEKWEDISKAEKAAAEAAQPGAPMDPPLENLDLPALRAVAFDKNVNSEGLGKKDLIAAIKAANEPRL